MVAVSRKFVKLKDLPITIFSMLKNYKKIRVEYPSEMVGYFLVKGWNKKKRTEMKK